MQRGLRVITLQGAIEKSPILLSQYWKNELLDGSIIISYFGGSNNIFADCMYIYCCLVCDEGPGICAHLLTLFSLLLIAATLPVSLCFVVKVVQVSSSLVIPESFNTNISHQIFEYTITFVNSQY